MRREALAQPVDWLRPSPLLALVGNTPLLDLSHLAPEGIRLSAKLEWYNPGGSVKDRPAKAIVEESIRTGVLRPGVRLLDATSGNTGIAYAWLGAALGFPVTLTLSEGASEDRKKILRALGVELIFTDPAETTDGAIRKARELAAEHPETYAYVDQYNHPANPRSHFETTGPEIWNQTQQSVTHFVAGLGTTGTLMGTGRYLKQVSPEVQLVGIEPDGPLHGLEGLKHLETAIVPGIFDAKVPDERLAIQTEDAQARARWLARRAGILLGTSCAAALEGAMQLANQLHDVGQTAHIVTLFPDNASKYLNTSTWSHP